MKISIITLSWDNLDYTQAFVKSIRKNTSLPYELIIVDNGSETKTQKWVKKNADRSIIFNTNQGFSKGFNEGLEEKAHPLKTKTSSLFVLVLSIT